MGEKIEVERLEGVFFDLKTRFSEQQRKLLSAQW